MKIIEALKLIKELRKKADDLVSKINQHCVDLDCENPVYPDQKRQISEWLQAHSDIIKEILHLRLSIQRTNIHTKVSIEIGNKHVEKTIAEWIHRRKDLAKLEEVAWASLHTKYEKEQFNHKLTQNAPEIVIKRRLYFDPIERDKKMDMYRSEPSKIDSALEITNAVTDLMEK